MDWLEGDTADRHASPLWSVQDAVDLWRVERRDERSVPFDDEDFDSDLIVTPVVEWNDASLNRAEAEVMVGSARTLRRWIQKELIAPEGTIYIAGVRTSLFRSPTLRRVKEQQESNRGGRPKSRG